MVCNNILFLILTRNTLSALLQLIPGSTVFFIGKKNINFIINKMDDNASILL